MLVFSGNNTAEKNTVAQKLADLSLRYSAMFMCCNALNLICCWERRAWFCLIKKASISFTLRCRCTGLFIDGGVDFSCDDTLLAAGAQNCANDILSVRKCGCDFCTDIRVREFQVVPSVATVVHQ